MSAASRVLFEDVFRRADKNDDGVISPEEFATYFADGVMSMEELEALFNEIDADHSGTLSVEEITNFFEADGRAAFEPLFESLLEMNGRVNALLMTLTTSYDELSMTEQFRRRFYLKEGLHQFKSLAHVVEGAVDGLEKISKGSGTGEDPDVHDDAPAPRPSRRTSRYAAPVDTDVASAIAAAATEPIADRMGALESHLSALAQAVTGLQAELIAMRRGSEAGGDAAVAPAAEGDAEGAKADE
eukprot:PLAT12180.1.p1 GENE.PLAT12180.1~~PLAT12180.1.p1  ORF type:complete len:243 (-),score=131.63 PLAT12180.1:135-863(-)